jgi:hypothetical protein
MNKQNQVLSAHCITCESIESVCIDCQFERELRLDRAAQAIGYPSAIAMVVGTRNINSSEAAKVVKAAVLANQSLDDQPAASMPVVPAWLANAASFTTSALLRGLGFGAGFGVAVVALVYSISAVAVFFVPKLYQIGGI